MAKRGTEGINGSGSWVCPYEKEGGEGEEKVKGSGNRTQAKEWGQKPKEGRETRMAHFMLGTASLKNELCSPHHPYKYIACIVPKMPTEKAVKSKYIFTQMLKRTEKFCTSILH